MGGTPRRGQGKNRHPLIPQLHLPLEGLGNYKKRPIKRGAFFICM